VDDAELEKVLRDHLAHGNSNPKRTGCPPPDEVRMLARNLQRSDGIMNEHLTVCSECFGLYQEMLRNMSTVPKP